MNLQLFKKTIYFQEIAILTTFFKQNKPPHNQIYFLIQILAINQNRSSSCDYYKGVTSISEVDEFNSSSNDQNKNYPNGPLDLPNRLKKNLRKKGVLRKKFIIKKFKYFHQPISQKKEKLQ